MFGCGPNVTRSASDHKVLTSDLFCSALVDCRTSCQLKYVSSVALFGVIGAVMPVSYGLFKISFITENVFNKEQFSDYNSHINFQERLSITLNVSFE